MFSAPVLNFQVNQVACGVYNAGEICLDATLSTTIGGGFWPKGTGNYYFFNSGPQVAGIIGQDGGPWAGDTSGAFFFDAKGTTQHGEGVTAIFSAANAGDLATWPAGAVVPGGAEGALYHTSLQGLPSASQGDAWWLMWDGNPNLLAGRAHPLGVLVEVRVMGWNYPSGNEDIMYVAETFYNITSLDPADYAVVRPELRSTLLQRAAAFHQGVSDELGTTLPSGGYTIDPFYAAMTADPDVANAGNNFASVNVPFSLSFAYDPSFSAFPPWTFDPRLYSSPFFPGTGFGGIALLTDAAGEGGLRVFSVNTNGGPDFPAARDAGQLYRFLSGQPSQLDGSCGFNVATQKICFIRQTFGADIRMLQSTGPMSLPPGGFETRVSAYVFAAPVRTAGSTICPACDIKPGSATIIAGLGDPAIVAGGVNPIDSLAGFLSASDLSGDGVLQMDEFLTVPRSFYGKAQLAQAIFDHQFLMPSAPSAPDFFLIPGDGEVTVMWRPSATEQTGDPFFAVAKDAQVLNGAGVLVANPLYDPNFRAFDVEGYRVYRGRTGDPAALTLLAQFDHAGTVISDYAGQVNPDRFCAPELGLTGQCSIAYDPIYPGQARTAHLDVPLVGPVEQIRFGDRIALVDGTAIHARTDTAGFRDNQLSDTGVPFVFVDNAVRNNFRYFYTVTAFDVNSWQSGPSTFESSRVVKETTPVRRASNYVNTAAVTSRVYGRGVALTDSIMPALDPATGLFSKPFPPTRDWHTAIENLVPGLIGEPGVVISIFLDSLELGDAYGANGTCTPPVPGTYYLRIITPTQSSSLTLPLVQSCFNQSTGFSTSFDAVPVDPGLASRFGGNAPFAFQGSFTVQLAGNYYTNAFGRGCVNSAPGFNFAISNSSGCDYNGARWFNGPSPAINEVSAHPNACSAQNFTSGVVTCFSNAGSLTGVANIYEAKSYQTTVNVWRNIEGALGAAVRGTDYNVYWGPGGTVDSVIDVVYNVPVPFSSRMGASWGFLNASAAQPSGLGLAFDERAELTLSDFGCVEPFRSLAGPQLQIPCASTGIGDGPLYSLSPTAIPGSMAFFTGLIGDNRVRPAAPHAGIAMAMPGHIFLMELINGQLPPPGTVWTLRDYVGAIIGGGNGCALCQAGADGPYQFNRLSYRPIAVGSEIRLTVDVVNRVNAPTGANLEQVHTVPDPYYLDNEFEADAGGQVIKFVNLPQDAVIRIYSSSGVLVTLLEHHSQTFGGALDWNVRNRTGRRVASGVYFYHIEAGGARRVGRFTIVNVRGGF